MLANGASARISYTPDMLVLDVEARRTTTAEVVLRNESEAKGEFNIEVEYRRPGICTENVENWVSFSPRMVTLPPGSSRTIRVKFNGRDIQHRSECVLSLFAGEELKNHINLKVRVGMPIFIRWNKENRVSGKIISLKPNFMDKGQFAFSVKVKNTGALHLTPYGIAWLEKADGKHVWQVEVRPDQPVFPGETEDLVWEGKRPTTVPKGGQLGVRLFWGTLYGLDKLDAPGSAEIKIPLKADENPT